MLATRILRTSHGTNRAAFTPSDWAIFLSLSGIWGASFLFMAIGLDSFQPGVVTMLRIGFGAATLAFIPRARRTPIERDDWGAIAALAVIWVAIPFTIFPLAQQWIDSAVAGMLNGATPLFTAVVASVMLRALPGSRQILGLVVGFAGVVAIALPSAGGDATAAIGVILVVVATVCYAFATNILAPLQHKYGALPVMFRVQWVALLLTAPLGLYGVGASRFSWASLGAVLAVGVLGTGIAFVLMGKLVGSVGSTRAAFVTYLMPVVALILGVALRSEVIALPAIAGVVLVISGALLASRREI